MLSKTNWDLIKNLADSKLIHSIAYPKVPGSGLVIHSNNDDPSKEEVIARASCGELYADPWLTLK